MRIDSPSDLSSATRSAEFRSSRAERKEAGSFFTDRDVARFLAERAIAARLLDDLGISNDEICLELAIAPWSLENLIRTFLGPDQLPKVARWIMNVRILDPSCGVGVFLIEAWKALTKIALILDLPEPCSSQLFGIDISEQTAIACRRQIESEIGCGQAKITVGDATQTGILPEADIILGNPPWVRKISSPEHTDLVTSSVANISSWIVERSLSSAAPGARVSLVLPIATACTDGFGPAREVWDRSCCSVHTSHFDAVPCSLFEGVVQRVSIFEGKKHDRNCAGPDNNTGECKWYTTRYHRWKKDERLTLLDSIQFVSAPEKNTIRSIAKIGSELERNLLSVLEKHSPAGRYFSRTTEPQNRVFYKRRWSYFLLFCDFIPKKWDERGNLQRPSELKTIDIVPEMDAPALIAIYSSTLFWWYFSVFTDNRNINRRDLAAFPIPKLSDDQKQRLASLGHELMVELKSCSEVRTCTYKSVGTIRNTYYRQAHTRPVIDQIDRILADLYGMSSEQLSFILKYEYRFRS